MIANGKVFVGTNNGHGYIKRFPKDTDLGCLVCFDAATGRFLWQHSNEKLKTGRVHDWPLQGIVSTPVVHGNRLFYLTNRAVVTCLDTEGMRDGDAGPVKDEVGADDEADVVWRYDLMKELGVSPKSISGCSPTTDGERLFLITLNDGWLHSFDPKGDGNAARRFVFDTNPKDAKYILGGRGRRNLHVSIPVFHDGLVYVANGRNPEAGEADSDLWCIDPLRRTHGPDISEFIVNDKDGTYLLPGGARKLNVNDYFDESKGDKKWKNPDSGVVWHYTAQDLNGDGKTGFDETFHRSWSNPVIKDGLLVIADFSGLVHCLDAKSGKLHWTHDLLAACWSSPLIADGHIFIADEDGDVVILKHAKTLAVLAEINCEDSIFSTPVAVGNTLYVTTKTRLLAIQQSRTGPIENEETGPAQPHDRLLNKAQAAPKPAEDLQNGLDAFDRIFRQPINSRGDATSPNRKSSAIQPTVPKTSWASIRNDDGQRGVATSTLPRNLGLHWKLPTADGWVSSVAIVGNHVYAPSLTGYLYCVELNSGNVVWKYRSLDDPDPKKFAAGFRSAPRVTSDTVYVGDEDGVFHAVDRVTGKRKWILTRAYESGNRFSDSENPFAWNRIRAIHSGQSTAPL